MKRIYVSYGGVQYSIGRRDLDAVKGEIEAAVKSGAPHWLRVQRGEGTGMEAELLITPGVDIAVVGIDPGRNDGGLPHPDGVDLDGSGPAIF